MIEVPSMVLYWCEIEALFESLHAMETRLDRPPVRDSPSQLRGDMQVTMGKVTGCLTHERGGVNGDICGEMGPQGVRGRLQNSMRHTPFSFTLSKGVRQFFGMIREKTSAARESLMA